MNRLTLFIILLAFCVGAVAQKIKKIEYFFETDLGIGGGTMVTIATPATNIQDYSFSVPVVSLTNGFHKLYVRCLDDSNRWSLATKKLLYKQDVPVTLSPNATQLEYFLDTDPGVGNATKINFTAATVWDAKTFTVDVTSASNGFHNLFVRVADEYGQWSLATHKMFYKQDVPVAFSPKATKLEYFIDIDPGVGSATSVAFTAATLWEDKTFAVDLTSVSDGFHKLYVRAVDDAGNWSIATSKLFYRQQDVAVSNTKIKAFEYFVDADPGAGLANPVTISPPLATLENKALTIDLTGLTSGFHKLNIRALDDKGQWSTTVAKSFFMDVIPVVENLTVTKVEYFIDDDPGFGSGSNISFTQGANVDVQGSIDLTGLTVGFHKIFLRANDNLGRWSSATGRSFYMDVVPTASLPNIVKGEYFIDTDPGLGNGTALTVSASSELTDQVFTVNLNSVTAGFHKLYIRYKDARNNWSVSNGRAFYKDNSVPTVETQITELSYYVGMGNELAMNDFVKVADFIPGMDVKDYVFPVDLTGKEVGNYYLYAYAKDVSGRYTTMALDSFKICDNVAKADFTYTVASRTVTFTDLSQLAATYLWDFGDGYTSTEASPEHTYSINGSFNVCQTVSNDCNASTFCDTVTVTYNAAPMGNDYYVNINEDDRYTFKYADFYYYDEEGNALDHLLIYSLALGTGDSLLLNGVSVTENTQVQKAEINKLVYIPAAEQSGSRGNFYFKLNDGITYSAQYGVTFYANPINDPAIFTATDSSIVVMENAGVVNIEDWLQLDDGDPNESQSMSASVSVIDGANIFSAYPQLLQSDYSELYFTIADNTTGMSRVKLSVTDYGTNPYSNTQEFEFTIEVSPFEAQLTANKTEACTEDEVLFTSTSPTEGVSFAWNFGEGATPATFTGPKPVPVVYSTSGSKTVKLDIAGFGKTDTKSISINILDKPTASFLSGSSIFPLYDTVYFSNTSSGGSQWDWDFGDGTPIVTKYTLDDVKHKYSAQDNDEFTIKLTAINGICSDVDEQTITFIDAQPPVITEENFVSTYSFTESKTVSVRAKDLFYGVKNAKFYFKGVSGNQWGSRNITAADSFFVATIEETMGDEVGIEYYFDVFNKLGIKRKSTTGFAYLEFTDGIDIPNISNGATIENYQIVSIPLSLERNSIDSVFEELGGYDNTKWRLFNYTPNKLLEYPTDFTEFEKGKGYWFISREAVTLNTGSGTTHIGIDFQNFAIQLRKGWTQIGNPYIFDVDWADIELANATNVDKIGKLRVYHNGNFSDSEVLSKFGGGFVFADEPGIELVIPVKKLTSRKQVFLSQPDTFNSTDWKIEMQLSAKNRVNNNIGFGMHPDADKSKDKYDQMTTPRFFNYLEANFNHPEYFYPSFATDVVTTEDSHIWEFTVEANLTDEPTTLTWDNLNAGILTNQMKLVDMKSHRIVDMKSSSRYTFLFDGSRNFKIFYGNQQFIDSTLVFEESVLGDCYPNPFNQQTQIPVFVKGGDKGFSRIELSVYSIDGRKIATIAHGEYQQGFHEFKWNMNNSQIGLKPGIYLYQLVNFTEGTTSTKRMEFIK